MMRALKYSLYYVEDGQNEEEETLFYNCLARLPENMFKFFLYKQSHIDWTVRLPFVSIVPNLDMKFLQVTHYSQSPLIKLVLSQHRRAQVTGTDRPWIHQLMSEYASPHWQSTYFDITAFPIAFTPTLAQIEAMFDNRSATSNNTLKPHILLSKLDNAPLPLSKSAVPQKCQQLPQKGEFQLEAPVEVVLRGAPEGAFDYFPVDKPQQNTQTCTFAQRRMLPASKLPAADFLESKWIWPCLRLTYDILGQLLDDNADKAGIVVFSWRGVLQHWFIDKRSNKMTCKEFNTTRELKINPIQLIFPPQEVLLCKSNSICAIQFSPITWLTIGGGFYFQFVDQYIDQVKLIWSCVFNQPDLLLRLQTTNGTDWVRGTVTGPYKNSPSLLSSCLIGDISVQVLCHLVTIVGADWDLPSAQRVLQLKDPTLFDFCVATAKSDQVLFTLFSFACMTLQIELAEKIKSKFRSPMNKKEASELAMRFMDQIASNPQTFVAYL